MAFGLNYSTYCDHHTSDSGKCFCTGAVYRRKGEGRVRHAVFPERRLRGGVSRRPAADHRRQEEGGRIRRKPRHRLLHVLLPVPLQNILVRQMKSTLIIF